MEEADSIKGESDHLQKPACQNSVSDNVIEKPKQGMEFKTYNALHDYYARYARQEGFAVCKRTSKKGKDGNVKYVCVQCCRGRKPSNKGSNPLKPRPQTALNCPAKIRATFGANDKFIISFVCLEHNHENSPGKVKLCKSNRKIDEETKQKLEIESQEDANSRNSFIPCISEDDELEKQFQSVYTNDKVVELQIEIRRIRKCQIWTRSEGEYEIKEWIFIGDDENKRKKRVSFKVLFNEETNETQCNCRNFEVKGIVCAHQLIVWNDMGISKVPDKYVLRRWCKNVKRADTKVGIGYDKILKRTEPSLCENMYRAFKDVVESVEDSKEKYEKVMAMCRELKQEFDDASTGICVSNIAVEKASHDECALVLSNHSTTILDPESV